MKHHAKRFFKHLSKAEMPLWLTLALFVITALGTYHYSPKINARFEQQKMTSAYITSNLDSINTSTQELIADLQTYNDNLVHNKESDKSLIKELNAKIIKLQWRTIEFNIIFDDKASLDIINEYNVSLDKLREGIETKNIKAIVDVTPQYLKYSKKIIRMLGEKAGLTIHELDNAS